MRTIATALQYKIAPVIAAAHAALVAIEPHLPYSNIKDPSDRQDVLEAISMLGIEIEAEQAKVGVDAERRVLLLDVLRKARNSIRNNAFGSLVGKDQKEGAMITGHVEVFEIARREITAFCADLMAQLKEDS